MKLRLILTQQARLNLELIWAHIAAESVSAADRFLDRFETEIELLALFPYRGEADPRVGGYRRILLGSYLIFYDLKPMILNLKRFASCESFTHRDGSMNSNYNRLLSKYSYCYALNT